MHFLSLFIITNAVECLLKLSCEVTCYVSSRKLNSVHLLLPCCVQLNLASQSVLEGLNACFDHRSEVFIPELAMSFKVKHELTRFFACQNPVCEGGGRKNLPRSFLNRFTQVYMDPMTTPDLLFITSSSYPQIPGELLEHMVEFNQQVAF